MMNSGRASRSASASVLQATRILVVEDEALIALEIASILSGEGAEIVGPMMTVKDALACIGREPLSGAVLDLSLHCCSVAPVARQLARRGVPFFFYTGQADVAAIRAEWPASPIIPKPATQDTLIHTLASLLAAHAAPN